MYQYKDQKEMRQAINGKTITMLVGALLVFNVITSTVPFAGRCMLMARDAAKGDKEILKTLADANVTVAMLWVAGIIFILKGIMEAFAGVFCVKFNNRLDKAKLIFKIAIALLVAELVYGVALMFLGLQTIFGVISSLMLPAFLIWSVSKLIKMAKDYPDRMYAVEPNKGNNRKQPAQGSKKSIRERAAAQVADEEKVAQVVDEIEE